MKSVYCLGWILLVVLISCWLLVRSQSSDDGQPTVSLQQGKALGKIMKSTNGKLFNAFLGIPYGKAERFTAPGPAGPWSGVLDATKDGSQCMQIQVFIQKPLFGQEDCLTLNVYTPSLPSTDQPSLLPVLVFIHGGGFISGEGSSTVYGPERYMNSKTPVVLVLMNYRLGPLGFLSTGDEASPGNYGLLDQVQALKWIQENIGIFNGDKNKVTITGESAGASSVIFHLVSPLSSELFHGAIAQSGSAICQWALDENPLENAKKIAEGVNCTTATTADMMDCLKKTDAAAIVEANFKIFENELGALPTKPVVENIKNGKFLTESPLKLLSEGRFNKVPVMTGFTEDESSIFILLSQNNKKLALPQLQSDQDENWDKVIKMLSFGTVVDPSAFTSSKDMYFKNSNYSDINNLLLQMIKFHSDLNFKSCSDKTVRLLSAAGVPVYAYIFDYINADLAFSNYTGSPDVAHSADLLFLFNYTEFGAKNLSEEALSVSDEVVDMWTSFATSGNPTPSGPPTWNPTNQEHPQYFNISLKPEMVQNYQTETMQFWDGINLKT